ncbi:MAG: MFS transporter [Bacteroidetes bacterium 24-39-8]|jgi:MFS family permease|nr:MAG: MFS transporter [Bacteroidetes bacterium 24-39-8]
MTSIPVSKNTHRIAVAVFFFIAGLSFASWASRIPDIKLHLGLTEGGLGLILFALPAGIMISLPFTGWIISKWSSRTILLIAAILYPLTLVMIGLVQTPIQLAITLFLFGTWSNFFNISVNTQAIAVEQLYGKTIMASFHGIWSLAGFTGAAVGTLMISLGLVPFWHFCIVTGISIPIVIWFNNYTVKQDAPTGKQPLFAKPDKTILLYGLIAFGSMVCEGTMFDWSGVYFQKAVQAPTQWVTLGYLLFMGAMATGRFISDRFTTRFGIKPILQASGALIATGLMISVLFPFLIPAGIGFLMVGLGVSSVIPLIYSAAGRSKTMNPGVALAAVSTIGFIGFLLGPPLIGSIAQMASLRWSFTLIACLGLLITVLAKKMH